MNKDFEKGRDEMLASLRTRNYSPSSLGHYERALGFFFQFLEEKGILDLKAVGRETLKARPASPATHPGRYDRPSTSRSSDFPRA